MREEPEQVQPQQRERVLLMILLENGILGFIGGLIGVGIGLLGLLIIMSSGSIPSSTIPFRPT